MKKIGSLRTTFAGLAALLAGVFVTYFQDVAFWAWVVLPLALLAVNLAAAICVDPRLNRRPGLFVFHVALLAVVLLITYNRLTDFHGRIELVEHQAFTAGDVVVMNTGPWHRSTHLQSVAFTQGAIQVDYAPQLIRQSTRSQIDVDGQSETIGDTLGFHANGYKFYTTSNKGFAAVLSWLGVDGSEIHGAVHFPSYPVNEWNQKNDWTIPGGRQIEIELVNAPAIDASRAFTLRRELVRGVNLDVSDGRRTRTLRVGEEIDFGNGRLRLESVRLWMGYEVHHDSVVSWIFLAAAFGIAGIAWHFSSKGLPAKRSKTDDLLLPKSGVVQVTRV